MKRLTFWKIVAIGGVVVALGSLGTCLFAGNQSDLGRGFGLLVLSVVAGAVAFLGYMISRAVDDP